MNCTIRDHHDNNERHTKRTKNNIHNISLLCRNTDLVSTIPILTQTAQNLITIIVLIHCPCPHFDFAAEF